jgi:hypothetical protein
MHSFDKFELNEVKQLIKNRDLLVEIFKIKSYICSTKIPKYIIKQKTEIYYQYFQYIYHLMII